MKQQSTVQRVNMYQSLRKINCYHNLEKTEKILTCFSQNSDIKEIPASSISTPNADVGTNTLVVGIILSHIKQPQNLFPLRLVNKLWKRESSRCLRTKFFSKIQISLKIDKETKSFDKLHDLTCCIRNSWEEGQGHLGFPCTAFSFLFGWEETLNSLKVLCDFQSVVGSSFVRRLAVKFSPFKAESWSESTARTLEAFFASFQHVEYLEISGVILQDMETQHRCPLLNFPKQFKLSQLTWFKCHAAGVNQLALEILQRAPNILEIDYEYWCPISFLNHFYEVYADRPESDLQRKLRLTSYFNNWENNQQTWREMDVFEKLAHKNLIQVRNISLSGSGLNNSIEPANFRQRKIQALSQILRSSAEFLQTLCLVMTVENLEHVQWPILPKVTEVKVIKQSDSPKIPSQFLLTHLPNLKVFSFGSHFDYFPISETLQSGPIRSVNEVCFRISEIPKNIGRCLPGSFPNVTKLYVGSIQNLPAWGKIFWEWPNLEEIRLINVTVGKIWDDHHFPALDSFFTGLSHEEVTVRAKLLNLNLNMAGDFLHISREMPAIFECKALKYIMIRFSMSRCPDLLNFLTPVSYEFGFRHLSENCVVDISAQCQVNENNAKIFNRGIWIEKQ